MRQNRASSTALIVAAGVLRRHHVRWSRRFVSDESAQLSAAALELAGGRWGLVRWLASSYLGDPLAWLLERVTVPGITLHYVLRKRAIEEATREAIAGGIRRVIVLGAGFDALGARLADEGVDVTEVDHPATQALKAAALRRTGLGGGLKLIAADLSREFPEHLFAGERCIVIAEGLLMYLEPERLRELVRGPSRELAPGSLLIMTFLQRYGQERLGFRSGTRLVEWWLHRLGEPFTWGIYPTRLKGLLRIARFNVIDLIDHSELRERFLKHTKHRKAKLPLGEVIGIAVRVPHNPRTESGDAKAPADLRAEPLE